MNVAKRLAIGLSLIALTVSFGGTLSSCSSAQSQQQQLIKIDGSSTVFPITDAIAKKFKQTQTNVEIQVNISGTTGGFAKFCAGETDINNASRPILTKEMEACKKAGVQYIELPVAFDALTVAVNPQNNWVENLTIGELKKMWEPQAEGNITKWNQIRPSWPDKPLNLYGAGKDSGTFDYFTEVTVGTADASRNDYTASEDDNVLVAGVSKDPNALGYFGFAYYEANKDKLKAIAIDSGKGPVLPNTQTVEKAQYQPLSRPLFIYVNAEAAENKPAVISFVKFYFNVRNLPQQVSSVGYVPLPNEAYRIALLNFYERKVGTVFEGRSQINLSIRELLRKEESY